ncbi:MAG: hypothetical protein CSA81_00805 [Acidobacteria bacterium]|nr:MAG: hypothetical protein CSA81_00805 [Acidobacteriota bacterium]
MPILFLSVIERVDPSVPVFGVRAPIHMFCRFRDRQSELVLNFEATSGIMYEGDYSDDLLPTNKKAIENGVYLRDLTKKEVLASLIGSLVKKERRAGNNTNALRYADLMIQVAPNLPDGFIAKGSTLHKIAYETMSKAEINNKPLSNKEYEECVRLGEMGTKLLEYGLELGWEPVSDVSIKKYIDGLQKISRKK